MPESAGDSDCGSGIWESQAECVDTCSSDESSVNSSEAVSSDEEFIASDDECDASAGEDEAADKSIRAPLKRQCNRRVLLSDSDDEVEVPTVIVTVGAIDIPDIQEGD
jgi:hypothetical protein